MSSNSQNGGGPIKVAHIATVDRSLRIQLLAQMRSLQEAGYDVYGIASPGPESAGVTAAGIPFIPAPMTRRVTPFADLSSLVSLYRILKSESFQIVHTHTPKAGLLGQIAATLAGTPVVVHTLHGLYFHDNSPKLKRRLLVLLEKLTARWSDLILSQSSEDVHTAVRERICDADVIRRLGNGVDVAQFDPRKVDPNEVDALRKEFSIPAESPVVGFVGRMVAEKGLHELLQAARLVLNQQPSTRFLIVGHREPAKADAVEPSLAAHYGVADACVFTGPRTDLPPIYQLMDVHTLPSHREGFPRTPMEAALMSKPSVVTDVRGCREAVVDGQTGLLVPPRDPGRLAAAILKLLGDSDLRLRLGLAARERGIQLFDERTVHEIVKTEYQRLLQERGLVAG